MTKNPTPSLMKHWYPTILPALMAAVLTVFAGVSQAREIHGKVINGTTGKPVGAIEVRIVDPRHGMATKGTIMTDAEGSFTAEDLDEKITLFLLQVDYQGVTYTEMTRSSGEEHIHVDVSVYETTTGWDDVEVSIPHLMARRSLDTLSVDRIYVVSNNTDPPRTIAGEDTGFRIYLPEERLRLSSLFVTSLGIPISVHPHPTDIAGIYKLSYPFKPGETRVGSSFDVAYTDNRYVYNEPLQYDIEEAIIMTEDPSMEVNSETLELGDEEEVRGLRAHRIASLPESSTLSLTFTGGLAHPTPQTASPQIVNLPEPWQRVSVILITGVTLLLVLLMVFATKSPVEGVKQMTLLASRRDQLLNRIAKLDDLYETGTVSNELYRHKRNELVDTLARIIHQIDMHQPNKPKTTRTRKGTTHAR